MAEQPVTSNHQTGKGKSAVVIGAGIAGASTAYFLNRAGIQVTVIDAGLDTASHVPSALINPVRGQSGRVDEDALAGMDLVWRLIRELEVQGHSIAHGQTGVIRPVPDDHTRAKFGRHLPAQLKHDWIQSASLLPGFSGQQWKHHLWLPEAGWVSGHALCGALLAASGSALIRGKAVTYTAHAVDVCTTESTLSTHQADFIFYCGGSRGATWGHSAQTGAEWASQPETHRMGSVLLLDRPVSAVPLSFGAYLSPEARSGGEVGGVLGGTFEAPSPVWQAPRLPLASLDWLLQKGEALADLSGIKVTGRWTGSRLSGLRRGPDQSGVWRLSGLSSKGFLLGPLYAKRLVERALSAAGRS